MIPDRRHVGYVVVFVAAAAAVLLPVLALNYLLVERSVGGASMVVAASRWQQAAKGVTYAPPLNATQPFKTARIFDRMHEIDTVVFGSSTAMGITQQMFPPGTSLYNFAQTGNGLPMVIGEAEFLRRAQPARFKRFLIPLDWSLGFIYNTDAPLPVTLAPPDPGAPNEKIRGVTLVMHQLEDALSLPRVKNLFGILHIMLRSPAPAAAFRQVFLQEAGDEYRCADGTPAKDFDTIFRGTCTGFRYDGSATFANLSPVPARRAPALIASALVPSSKYVAGLVRTGGEPNRLLLDGIAALAAGVQRAGGSVILFLPPLLPGMERAFLDATHTGGPLRHTKQALEAWARERNLIIIDAGQSERYGCLVEEFVDEHHALPQCYARIFGRFWSDPRALAKPGLWNGER